MYLEWSYKVKQPFSVIEGLVFILALKEQTLTYTVVIAVMHVAWILWIIASGREVVQKLENHDYSVYP